MTNLRAVQMIHELCVILSNFTATAGIPGWQEADKLVSTFTTRYFPSLRPGDINQEVFSDIMLDHLGEHARCVAIDTLRERTCENILTVSKRIQAKADAARATMGVFARSIRALHRRPLSMRALPHRVIRKLRFQREDRNEGSETRGLISMPLRGFISATSADARGSC